MDKNTQSHNRELTTSKIPPARGLGGRRVGRPGHRAVVGLRSLRPEQPDQHRLHRLGKSKHGRPAGIPGARRRPGRGGLRRQHGQPRLPQPEQFLGRKPGQDRVNAFYAKKAGVGQYKGCDAYNDFREVLGRGDVDAVVIVVPDHWHAIMAINGGRGGQGHVLREAAVADGSPRPGDGRGGAAAQTRAANRQHVSIQPGRPASAANWFATDESAS